jgi:hypothetical protein
MMGVGALRHMSLAVHCSVTHGDPVSLPGVNVPPPRARERLRTSLIELRRKVDLQVPEAASDFLSEQ